MKQPKNPDAAIEADSEQASPILSDYINIDDIDLGSTDDLSDFLDEPDFEFEEPDFEFEEPDLEFEEPIFIDEWTEPESLIDFDRPDVKTTSLAEILRRSRELSDSNITPELRSETHREFNHLLRLQPLPSFEHIFNRRFASILFSKPPLQPDKPSAAPGEYKGKAFILAYKDEESSGVQTVHAEADDDTSIDNLLKNALDFFDRNCGFSDFKAHWVRDSASHYSGVRFITAFNKEREQREVVTCSARHDYYLSINIGYSTSDQFTVFDIGLAIKGLIITGSLSYSDDVVSDGKLESKPCPRIVIAQLSDAFSLTSDMGYVELARTIGLPDSNPREPQRFISKVFSNDPFYTNISSKRNGSDFDYSVNSHKSRWNSIKDDMPDVPPLAPCESAKLWLYGSDCYTGEYFKHRKKDVIEHKNLKDSLMLTNEFLCLYFKISNRGFSLSLREVKGVVGAYQIALYHSLKSCYVDFVPPVNIDINIGPTGVVFKYDNESFDVNLADLIFEGWSVDISYAAWNPDHFYHEKTKGDFKEVVSHWLWVMLADQLFTSSEKQARYMISAGSVTSKMIDKAMVYTNLNVSDVISVTDNHKGRFVGVGRNDIYYSYEPSQVTSFEVTGLSFKVGRPLFEVYCKESHGIHDSFWSLFLSKEGEGFFNQDFAPSYTLLKVSASSGNVVAVYCFASIGSALKKLVSILLETERVKLAGMDQFDVTRSLINTARSFGCVIDVDFSFMSSQTEWNAGDPKYD